MVTFLFTYAHVHVQRILKIYINNYTSTETVIFWYQYKSIYSTVHVLLFYKEKNHTLVQSVLPTENLHADKAQGAEGS